MKSKKWIMHIDGDCFFASCEVSRRPDLFGKPVVVGEERGIATALTYPAKDIGIKRGDPIFKIRKEYPEVVVLSSHFELYNKFANNLSKILFDYVDVLEIYSIDECFAVITGSEDEIIKMVTKIKKEVQRKLGITYSFGVSITKTLAKVASKRNKPNGLCFLLNKQDIEQVLKNTKVENIWGIGHATSKKVHRQNVLTAFDFINSDLKSILKDSYTKPIFQTMDELCGNVHFEVGVMNPYQKSLQSTRTLISKTKNKNILRGELGRNVELACSQLRSKGLVTNRVYFFLSGGFGVRTFEDIVLDLPFYTASESRILKHIEQMFDKYTDANMPVYKKTGCMMLNLLPESELPQDLFGDQINNILDEKKINNVVDMLRNKFGYNSISMAVSLAEINRRGLDYQKRHVNDIYENGLPYPYLGIVI